MTQKQRLRLYLEDHPGASSLEIIRDLSITNATGRISDLRDELEPAYTVARVKRSDGLDGYRIVQVAPEQQSLAL
jgi:hypothetical protein